MTTTLNLTLIRGLPGSGKSTLATSLDGVHLEADQYFMNKQGEYHFDPTQIKQAHVWCLKQTEYYLSLGQSVVVANTFVEHWEMDAYKKIAKEYQAKLDIITCQGHWTNIHDVPTGVIDKMKRRWQD